MYQVLLNLMCDASSVCGADDRTGGDTLIVSQHSFPLSSL